MVAERKIFQEDGVEKYVAHQEEHESEPLKPGVAFPFVKVQSSTRAQYLVPTGPTTNTSS